MKSTALALIGPACFPISLSLEARDWEKVYPSLLWLQQLLTIKGNILNTKAKAKLVIDLTVLTRFDMFLCKLVECLTFGGSWTNSEIFFSLREKIDLHHRSRVELFLSLACFEALSVRM